MVFQISWVNGHIAINPTKAGSDAIAELATAVESSAFLMGGYGFLTILRPRYIAVNMYYHCSIIHFFMI